MINSAPARQGAAMGDATLLVDHDQGGAPPREESRHDPTAQARLRLLLEEHYDVIWRTLRRLGLDAGEADDGAQQVFIVAARRLGEIVVGGERPYLFGIALRVAADARKCGARRREQPQDDHWEAIDPSPHADELLDQQRARALLDEALERLPTDLRLVFTLHEVEEMSMSEIAHVLGLPAGTVASRLRRARQNFEAIIARLTKHPRAVAPGGAR